MIKLARYFNESTIVFLDATSRDEALQAMVSNLHEAKKISNPEGFYNAILEREKIVSTGIGMGVAIPHAKLQEYEDFFIAVGILQKGVEWNALDGTPVRLIFMIGGPDDKQTEYLQILSGLTVLLKDENRRKKILTTNSKDAIIQLFNNIPN